jgi:hypothetical protein
MAASSDLFRILILFISKFEPERKIQHEEDHHLARLSRRIAKRSLVVIGERRIKPEKTNE